jgi:mediator of RNA polymerase II transcription subunit 13
MARPPMRPGNPHAFAHPATIPSTLGLQKGAQGASTRLAQGHNHTNATDQPHALDCFTVYELFASSVTALISFFLVKNCGVVALNYRTLVSKPIILEETGHTDNVPSIALHWLTSIHIHWFSSGTLLVSTSTERTHKLQCLDGISAEDQKLHVGRCIRVAPNAMLATISSFEDPLEPLLDDSSRRVQRKKAKISSLEQSIERWKSTVERWLSWRGYSLPNLDKKRAWVSIRIAHSVQLPTISPVTLPPDRDMLWPRALCFLPHSEPMGLQIIEACNEVQPRSVQGNLRWFEGPGLVGFLDPMDVAQSWYLGKIDRDKIQEARRKVKKAEEDALRRKDEPSGLHPSSPFNSRTGVYGDLQPVSGVYPTPPDGVAPGLGLSSNDTPSVTGATSNIILAPGGTTPAINLSAPQDHPQIDEQHPSTSPLVPSVLEPFQTSGEDDDLFEDMEEDGYGAAGVNEADFDFFDGPSGDDVHMADAPSVPQNNAENLRKHDRNPGAMVASESAVKEDMSDPTTALEKALATTPHRVENEEQDIEDEHLENKEELSSSKPTELPTAQQTSTEPMYTQSQTREPTPPLSPGVVAKTLRSSPPTRSSLQKGKQPVATIRVDSAFHSLDFGRRMSLVDAKYQDGRFAAQLDASTEKEAMPSSANSVRIKSLRDLPLLTKLRYSMGVASASNIPEVMSLARADSDDSDSEAGSDISDASEEDTEEAAEVKLPPFLGRLVIPAKRKLPTEGHGTPLSVTSFAESLAGEWHDSNGLQFDEASLAFFEPNTWDWTMANLPSPTERPLSGARYAVPVLPASSMQLPDTPTSQPDLYMDMPEDKLSEKPSNGKDSIAITQIITDQIILATLDVLGEDRLSETKFDDHVSSEIRWQATLKEIFPSATDCTLSTLVAIHDVFPDLSAQGKGQQRLPPRKPNESSAIPSNHIYSMNPPFVRVRRAETHWDLLPPSIAFWEPLGLAPVSAPKNVVAFCIYPHSNPLRSILERFLLNLQLAYDTCKLGTHARVETVMEFEGGLVPCKLSSLTSPKEAFKALRETCIQLGKLLAIQHSQMREQQDVKIDAFVIYMVDPFDNPSALWELCSAFWALFQAYGQGPAGRLDGTQKPDVVLQIVPVKYLASFDVPVVLDASTYINLAREVYDRCPPSVSSTDKTPLSIYKAPAFQLEESLPRSIQFKLMSEPPQDLLRENSYMHLAYAVSLDGAWVTAAWTDSCGKSQAVVSYHLGTRVFGEIAKEIWQTTIDILQSRRVQWRVCIAKAGPMDREELETWVLLITCPTQVNLFLTLLTVVEDSPYKFMPAIPPTNSSGGQQSANTPGSTPQAGVSPDPTVGLTPAATPSADAAPDPSADPEARLVDVTDETWGIILAHRLHNSNSTNQFSPALISGLMVKRGETHATSNSIHHPIPDPFPGPIVTAVNIVWIGAVGSTRAATSPFPPATDGVSPGGYASGGSAPPSPQERSTSSLMWTPTVQTRSTAENLLKEVLAQFRALGLLAKLRGMRGTRHGSVPWHVVAAKRGVEGLSKVTGGI